MKTEETLSKGIIKRIVFIAFILLIILGIGVLAGTRTVNSVKIKFSDGTELSVLTTKSNVNDILKENNIYILDDEVVVPGYDENVDYTKTITISRFDEKREEITEVADMTVEVGEIIDSEDITIVEKIVKETEEIPFETITKEVSNSNETGEKVNKVVQEGKNGIKEITYKVRYENDIEVARTKISEVVIEEPVDKIVNVSVKTISSRSETAPRVAVATSGSVAEYQAYAKQRCDAYGWSENDYYCLVALWNRESRWDPNAHNRSSGAHGIPQALPASKMASAGADYMTNYQTQINWGLSYISGRYGTPSNAYAHSQRTGWY